MLPSHRLALAYKLVRSKADWERWMESFGTETTGAELSLPALCPLLWQLTFVRLHKRNSPPRQVCEGTKKGALSSPTLWTVWGSYTEPSTDTEERQIPPRCDTPHWQITLYSNVVPQQTEQFLNHSLRF